eukprot:INCI1135.2.p1 GENE.INCI1135.2~~INCI1135.2.p1  ORF type:complete len:265 (+),score=34.95 INCI1135.2:162-956(+)
MLKMSPSPKAKVVALLALVVPVCGQDELDLTPYNDAQMNLCNEYGADPLNLNLLIAQSATLTAQGATACTPALLSAPGGAGLGPCLEQLGLFGYEVVALEDDWQCGSDRFDVSTCSGLQCNTTYIQTETSINKANGEVYYECIKQISYNGLIFNAPESYFFIPAGCKYNTAWDAKYACFGGQTWNAFASPCPTTCHYTPTQDDCSAIPMARCACPEEKPVWDRLLGCTTQEICDEVYGEPVEDLDDIYKPVRQAEPFPYNWDGS